MRRSAQEFFPQADDSRSLKQRGIEHQMLSSRMHSTNTRVENLVTKSVDIIWNFLIANFSDALEALNIKVDKRSNFSLAVIAIYFAAEEIQLSKIELLKAILSPKPFDISGNIIHLYHLQNKFIYARKNLQRVVSHWDYLKPNELEKEYSEKEGAAQEALKNLIEHLVGMSSNNQQLQPKKYAMKISLKIPEQAKFKSWKTNTVNYYTTSLSRARASDHLIKDLQAQFITDTDLAIDQLLTAYCKENQDELAALMFKCITINQRALEQIAPMTISLMATDLALLIARLHGEEQEDKIKLLEDDRKESQKMFSGSSDRITEESRKKQSKELEIQMCEFESTQSHRRTLGK